MCLDLDGGLDLGSGLLLGGALHQGGRSHGVVIGVPLSRPASHRAKFEFAAHFATSGILGMAANKAVKC